MYSATFLKYLTFHTLLAGLFSFILVTGYCRNNVDSIGQGRSRTHTYNSYSALKMVAPIAERDRINSISKSISNANVEITSLQITDIFQVLSMCNGYFLPVYASIFERFELNLKILQIFLPKFVLSEKTGHNVIALKLRDTGEMIGMVDISLQTNDGTLDCLKPSWLKDRQQRYNNKLHPYICNLLVSPEYRNQGMASRLVQACEEYSQQIKKESIQNILNQNTNNNYNSKSPLSEINDKSTTATTTVTSTTTVAYPPVMITHMHLHVESNQIPALSLYLKQGFTEVSRVRGNDYDVIFMRKAIPS